MERFNPFASPDTAEKEGEEGEEARPVTNYSNNSSSLPRNAHLIRQQSATRTDSSGSLSGNNSPASKTTTTSRQQIGLTSSADATTIQHHQANQIREQTIFSNNNATSSSSSSSRYSTNFPDPFGDLTATNLLPETNKPTTSVQFSANKLDQNKPSNRSNSVTFASCSRSVDDLPPQQQHQHHHHQQQTSAWSSPSRAKFSDRGQSTVAGISGGGLTSFLSRATSVTSSTVTDRVSGAVGSVRSAVDSISNQIQQAVPANLNERISSATGQFVGVSSSSMMPIISRQRIVLILDNLSNTDWAQQFNSYRRLMSADSFLTGGAQSTLSSFFTSATAQLTSSASTTTTPTSNVISCGDGLDLLIEQADFREVSVLANQITSTATVIVATNQQRSSLAASILSASGTGAANQANKQLQQQQQQQAGYKIIRPEYVVVRQKTKDLDSENVAYLKGIVKGLNYCLIPMFEPIEIWSIFQDRQLIFSKLLKVQKLLGKESFPLIQQIYFQTYQDLLNYLNNSTITFPCLLRCGSIGKGKIRIDNQQMLKDFSSIVATSGMSCTIEQYLDVKCDLIIQKMGTSLKIFKKNAPQYSSRNESSGNVVGEQQQQQQRQSASRQTSIGSSVISSIISSTTSSSQQQNQSLDRKNSYSQQGASYEKLSSDVGVRYKMWLEAISKEFDNLLEAFCLKIALATNDREYVVGLTNCSNNFMGTQENQDEDRRSFVELIINNMNANLPNKYDQQHHLSSPAIGATNQSPSVIRRTSSGGPNTGHDSSAAGFLNKNNNTPMVSSALSLSQQQQQQLLQNDSNNLQQQLKDKKKFISQSQINNNNKHNNNNNSLLQNQQQLLDKDFSAAKSFGQLTNRSQSISVNQSDYYSKGGGSGGILNSLNYDDINNKSASQLNNNKPLFNRRSSERSDSLINATGAGNSISNDFIDDDLSFTADTPTTASYTSSGGAGLHQRQTSLGQSFFDQTSTALSSFQKQSMSFFKRLDARGAGDLLSSTPPQSAKSDKAFDKSFLAGNSSNTGNDLMFNNNNNTSRGFKSQSIDSSAITDSGARTAQPRRSPPKPPPPPPIVTGGTQRQSSLASYSSGAASYNNIKRQPGGSVDTTKTPNSTPVQTRQNSAATESGGNQTKTKVVRQNSALSAFEPYDPDIAAQLRESTITTDLRQFDSKQQQQASNNSTIKDEPANHTTQAKQSNNNDCLQMASQQQQHSQPAQAQKHLESVKRSSNFDSASITSGDSNSTGETTTAEDTMNNLKKTFASIFGDKCE